MQKFPNTGQKGKLEWELVKDGKDKYSNGNREKHYHNISPIRECAKLLMTPYKHNLKQESTIVKRLSENFTGPMERVYSYWTGLHLSILFTLAKHLWALQRTSMRRPLQISISAFLF